MNWFLAFLILLLPSCSWHPKTEAYRQQYAHLRTQFCHVSRMRETDYFLVILVDALHLDYTENKSFFRTMVKHPSDGSKNCDVGHAWIYVQGIIDGQPVYVEGGHSGELGIVQPKYFEGIVELAERGDPNPARYLWETQHDGFFQEGSGDHHPTFAAKIDIDEQQFTKILEFIESYDYSEYAITRNQCSSFVAQVAALADFSIEYEITMKIDKTLGIWKDSKYSTITFSTPDVVERSLMQAVKEGRAEYALSWYKKNHRECPGKRWRRRCRNLKLFPSRIKRVLYFW